MTKKEQIIELYANNHSYAEIAEQVKVSKSYISQVITRHNENKVIKEIPQVGDTAVANDVSNEHDHPVNNERKAQGVFKSIEISRPDIVYDFSNIQSQQGAQSNMDGINIRLASEVSEHEEREEIEHIEEIEEVEEIDFDVLKHEFLGVYETINLIFDNFSFYKSKPIQKGKIDAIVENFKRAYPGKNLMNSKVLFFTLVLSVFASNINIKKVKLVDKIKEKFNKK